MRYSKPRRVQNGLDDGCDGMVTGSRSEERVRAIVEFERCEADFWYFTKYLRIPDANKGAIPFAQWEHLEPLARAWQAKRQTQTGKGRQNGVSYLAAGYSLWDVTFHDLARVLVVSMGQREASEFMEKVRWMHKELPPFLRFEPFKSNESTFMLKATESQLQVLPSTMNAGRGFQASTFFFDEFAFHPFAGDNYAAARATVADGGAMHLISTGNGPTGMFHDEWYDPESTFEKFFIPWNARPDRDEEWYAREERAYRSAGKSMFFRRENPKNVVEMFSAFVGLVYDIFEDGRHVRPAPFSWEQSDLRIAGIDPGQGDPFAIVPIGRRTVRDENGNRKVHHHQFDEFYEQDAVSIPEIIEYLMEWHMKAPFHGIAVDGAEGTLIETLRAHGLPAFAANKERRTGIALVRSWLEADALSVETKCEHTKREFKSYRWSERRAPGEAQSYTTSTPVDHHGDAMDAIRYACMALAEMVEGAPPTLQPSLDPEYRPPTPPAIFYDPMTRGQRTPRRRRVGPDYRTRRVAR